MAVRAQDPRPAAALAHIADPALRAAYEHCRRLHARYGRTYYLATSLLPPQRRPHIWALYAFARHSDELVDDPGGPDVEGFDAWRSVAAQALRSSRPPHPLADPILSATWHTAQAYDLHSDLFEEFLAAMTMDLSVRRYPTWSDLRGYMRGSAAVIGELTAPVLGVSSPDALRHAGWLGEAFQLTNFIRDVGEDLGRGRIYLPMEDLRATGVDEADLVAAVRDRRPSTAVRRLLAFEVARAQELYDLAEPGLAMVDAPSRSCLQAAFLLYREILDLARGNDFDVFAGRLRVPTWRRGVVAAQMLIDPARPVPPRVAAAGTTPSR